MRFLPYQISLGSRLRDMLYSKGFAYLQGEPRTGKTPTTLSMVEMSCYNRILIICPKGARGDTIKGKVDGWYKFLIDEELNLQKDYTLINYERVYKRKVKKVIAKGHIREHKALVAQLAEGSLSEEQTNSIEEHINEIEVDEVSYPLRINPKDYDLVILDEAHNVGGVGAPSLRYNTLRELCYDLPVVFLSGTATTENPLSIYYQTTITKYSVFSKYPNFYEFFNSYGIPSTKRLGKITIQEYVKYHNNLLDTINDFTIFVTQDMIGLNKDIQAVDVIHYVELTNKTIELIEDLIKHRVVKIPSSIDNYEPVNTVNMAEIPLEEVYVADTPPKLRGAIAHIENGIFNGTYLGNLEKIQYIMKEFGDKEENVIMSHYPKERELLEMFFKHSTILSSTSHAEGVDLSNYKNFIVISQDYRGAKYIQRRNRVVNIFNTNEAKVNFILSKGFLSEAIYKAVKDKKDFTDSLFTTYVNDALI